MQSKSIYHPLYSQFLQDIFRAGISGGGRGGHRDMTLFSGGHVPTVTAAAGANHFRPRTRFFLSVV